MKSRLFLSIIFTLFISIFTLETARAATITVTEKSDSFNMGNCSLRDAVESVNMGSNQGGCSFSGAFGSNDTINLEAGTYTLSIPDGGSGNSNGDLDIIADVVIQGQGIDATTVMGAYPDPTTADRIFKLSGPITVSFVDFTVSNGGSDQVNRDGGGIRVNSAGNLTLERVRVADNQGGEGGGIFNNNGNIFIQQSIISGNIAQEEGGGIENSGDILINETTIDDNEGPDGGGIFNELSADIVIYNTTISNNRAIGGLGQGGGGDGGGMFISTICDTIFAVNTTISGNDAAQRGGGIFVNSSACADSESPLVGQGVIPVGIFLLNDTIAFNEAVDEGGGIWFQEPQVSLSEVGITGLFDIGLGNTILALNQAPTGPDCFEQLSSFGFNLFGDTTDCTVDPLSPDPDQTNPSPGLGPLQSNGGPTFTHGLFDDSPAIDMGNNLPGEGCQAPDLQAVFDNGDFSFVELMRDQRDFPRPIAVLDPNDPICDVGAFEFQVFGFTVTKDDGLGGAEIEVDTQFDYTITVTNNGPGTATAVTLDDPLPSGMDFISVNTSQGACAAIGQVIGCDLGDLAVGETATITVTVIATEEGTFTNIVTITLNNPFQQQLTETAQVTTVVGGDLFVFGSGFHCEFHPGAVGNAPKGAHYGVLGLMALAMLGIPAVLRRRPNDL